jgi:hypothetical protein
MGPPTSVPEVVFRDSHGELIVRRPASQLLAVTAKGVASEPLVHRYFREFHAFVGSATRKVDVFLDWHGLTSYDPAARRTYTEWADERRELNRRVCRGVHVLVGSTLVYLALEASGGLSKSKYRHAYRDPKSFEHELQRCLRSPASELVERTDGSGSHA